MSLSHLTKDQLRTLHPGVANPIEYRKTGLSLNHIIGCPLDCSYCVRHFFDAYDLREPTALMSDEDALAALLAHEYFQPHTTPLQIFNRATDPLLPQVLPHTLNVLSLIDAAGLTNHVILISRYRITEETCQRLNELRSIRLSLLFTYSGIDHKEIEPIDSQIAINSMHLAYSMSTRYKVLLYLRPLVPGLNTNTDQLRRAAEYSRHSHATVFSGLFYRPQIEAYYKAAGLPLPFDDTARRKILTPGTEADVIRAFQSCNHASALFRKTSCGVCFVHGEPDYNGHATFPEICDICPAGQLQLCSSLPRPSAATFEAVARRLGAKEIQFGSSAVEVEGLDEERRYFLQHTFRYQVHDVKHPHKKFRHGRADLGWSDENASNQHALS
jgi:DNA repair photolyase